MNAKIDASRPQKEVPIRQRRLVAKALTHFLTNYVDRDQALAEAYRTGAYSMQAIADHFGVGRMTVSRAINRVETNGNANVQ